MQTVYTYFKIHKNTFPSFPVKNSHYLQLISMNFANYFLVFMQEQLNVTNVL